MLAFALCMLPTSASALAAHPIVDLRSDTVTTPTASMRAAMASAEVGDDVFGDDPTVHALEARVASLFDKEAAVFVPTGTMSNLVGLMAHTWERGSEYVVGDEAHIHIFEQGGAAQFGGAHPRALLTNADGTVDLERIRGAIRPSDQHFPITRAIALENTHNLRGGKVLPLEYVRAVGDLAHEHGLALHLDGARVWHAAAALGVTLEEVGAPCDSLSVCLSKALGAPAGSVFVGSAEIVARARRLRKGLGGVMRQTGVLAAAGLVALDEVLPHLADDHRNAQRLAAGLQAAGFAVDAPQSNLIYFSPSADAPLGFAAKELVAACATEGVRFLVVPGADPNRMRMVCHHQVTADGVERALEVIGKACAQPDWVAAAAAGGGKAASYAGSADAK